MTVAIKSKEIESNAHELAMLSVKTPGIDNEQLIRFTMIDQQIKKYGVKVLTGLSDEELVEDLLYV